jgi:hypothetical protein
MAVVFGLDTKSVRQKSQREITRLGGPSCDWLPWLDRTSPRSEESAVSRTLVMNAFIQIHFGAPVKVIETWIRKHGLLPHLSPSERELLAKADADLTAQEVTDLYWYIEALWALAWAGSLIPSLSIHLPVGEELARLMPNLQVDEPPDRLRSTFKLRPPAEIYQMLDLYFLAHWYARDGSLRGEETGPFNLDVIMERRKALEWVMNAEIPDWDQTPQDT